MADLSVKPERLDDFREWINETNKIISKFDGFIARRLLRGADGTLRVVVRFESPEQLSAMHGSDEHHKIHGRVVEFLAEPPSPVKYEIIAG